jgi:hypothetical protein
LVFLAFHYLKKMSAVNDLRKCGDIQRTIFFTNFLVHTQVGEMICVSDESTGDSYMFERWQINGVDFVACFRLLSEDSLISAGIHYVYKRHEILLEEKTYRQRQLHQQFLDKLAAEGKTLAEVKRKAEAQGKDPTLLDCKEYTRDMLEDKLPAGKKTIQGDRNTYIEVLERQQEVPNDLQRPRLNRFILTPSKSIRDFIATSEESFEESIALFKSEHLEYAPRDIPVNTSLPFLRETILVVPEIFEFPAKELNL